MRGRSLCGSGAMGIVRPGGTVPCGDALGIGLIGGGVGNAAAIVAGGELAGVCAWAVPTIRANASRRGNRNLIGGGLKS